MQHIAAMIRPRASHRLLMLDRHDARACDERGSSTFLIFARGPKQVRWNLIDGRGEALRGPKHRQPGLLDQSWHFTAPETLSPVWRYAIDELRDQTPYGFGFGGRT
jgi:hypothetical protein